MLPRISIGFAFIAALLASAAAEAVTLYKLVDSKGRVMYAETPPSDFNGKVIPLDIAIDTNAIAPNPPKAVAADKVEVNAQAPEPDYLTKRRATRSSLEARLKQARDKLENAKLALANATMEEDEFQAILKPVSKSPGGASGADTRMDCKNVERKGRMVRACGTVVPNEKFVEKMSALEAAVKMAEEEVAEAEIGWRRGVD